MPQRGDMKPAYVRSLSVALALIQMATSVPAAPLPSVSQPMSELFSSQSIVGSPRNFLREDRFPAAPSTGRLLNQAGLERKDWTGLVAPPMPRQQRYLGPIVAAVSLSLGILFWHGLLPVPTVRQGGLFLSVFLFFAGGFVFAGPHEKVWSLKPGDHHRTPSGRVYEQLLEGPRQANGQFDFTADWHRLTVVAEAILTVADGASRHPSFTVKQIQRIVKDRLAAQNLGMDRSVGGLLDQLVSAGLIRKNRTHYSLEVQPSVLAVKMRAVRYIRDRLRASIQGRPFAAASHESLIRLLEEFGDVSERWRLSPVEARWPFLKAVTLLSPEEQQTILEVLDATAQLRTDYPALDGVWIMLGQDPGTDWIEKQADGLIGRNIYTVAPEGWLAAGGLGRVQQYHAAGMKRLAGDRAGVITIESYYPATYGDPANPKVWSQLQKRFPGIERVTFSAPLSVWVFKEEVELEIYKWVTPGGVEAYFVMDAKRYYSNRRYDYDAGDSGNYDQYSEFLGISSLKLIQVLEEERRRALRTPMDEPYRPPVIIANDGQAGRFAKMRRHFEDFRRSDVLQNALIWMVTHTYGNRGRFQGQDATSEGISDADGASAVAAVHRDEVAPWDPFDRLIAITNGDDRQATRSVYLKLWKKYGFQGDPENPTPDEMLELKRLAKSDLKIPKQVLEDCGLSQQLTALNPDQPVLTYAGRLVDVKAGLDRAFTNANLEALLKAGIQVILATNVQPKTGPMLDALLQTAKQLNALGHPGRILVWSGWDLSDQRAILTATDRQMQDSHRATEAAGYTESDASAVGGEQSGPPWVEGIIQLQGMIDEDEGNTVIPADGSPAAYLQSFLRLRDYFWTSDGRPNEAGRLALAQRQARSVRLSRILAAELTSAEYLRQLNAALERKENPLEAIRQLVSGEPEAAKHFRKPWVRRDLAAYLRRPRNRKWALPLITNEEQLTAFVICLPGVTPFLLPISRENVWYPVAAEDRKRWFTIPFDGNEKALEVLFQGEMRGTDFLWQVWDAGMRVMYPREQTIRAVREKGWRIGIPYPGLQVLVPVLLDHVTEPMSAYRGLPVTYETPTGEAAQIYLRHVPDVPELGRLLTTEDGVRKALSYFLAPRQTEVRPGVSRVITPVPVRFLGDWGPAFLETLSRFIDLFGLQQGDIGHLIGPHPVSPLSADINSQTVSRAAPKNGNWRYFKKETAGGFVVVRDTWNPSEGMTSSMYSITDLWGRESEIAQAGELFHQRKMGLMIDITGHLAADAPRVVENPDFFKHDFPRHLFPNGLESHLTDAQILGMAPEGFLVYAPDPDYRLAQVLRARERLATQPSAAWRPASMIWGDVTIDGKRYVRYLLRHHEAPGFGPMHDTAALEFRNPAVRQWLTTLLIRYALDYQVDGFRFDLAQTLPDDFWLQVKGDVVRAAAAAGKQVSFLHEDYRSLDVKAAAAAAFEQALGGAPVPGLDLNLYYDNALFEYFRDHTDAWEGYGGLTRELLEFLQKGPFMNYLATHDEVLPLGRLSGARIATYFALETLAFTLPGSPYFYFPQALGWRNYDADGYPRDIPRQLTAEAFQRLSASEPNKVLPEFQQLMDIAHHPLLRERDATDTVSSTDPGVIAFMPSLQSKVYGPEKALVVINPTPVTRNPRLSISLASLGVIDLSEPRYFALYDLISRRLEFYTARQLASWQRELGPSERHVFLIREVINPSEEFEAAFDPEWPGQDVQISFNGEDPDEHSEGPGSILGILTHPDNRRAYAKAA
jgi:hypothetical protein